MSNLLRYADSSVMYWLKVGLSGLVASQTPDHVTLYRALELYYYNNGVYDLVAQALYDHGIWTEGMKGLRNPANRVVKFYSSKIWPGDLPQALPILADNKKIIEPIYQVWQWSNWAARKQLAARWLPLFGDLFIKVVTADNAAGEPARVYMQLIKPEHVTDLDHDERDYLTMIRLDIPQTRKVEGRSQLFWHTEVWNKDQGTYKVWANDKGPNESIERLGDPQVNKDMAEFGIDFVPFVHAKYEDTGEPRGMGAFVHALDKIDEANRQATRLAQMIFRYNKALWVVSAGGVDSTGRPLPPPRLGRDNAGTEASEKITLADDTILSLPGQATLDSLVPNINYESALNVLKDHMLELEKDLPELAYYRLREMGGDLSGVAVRNLLSDAVDKANEARGSAENALARAHMMALTIGQNAGIFSGLGSFEAGDFDHAFATRPVIPLTEKEVAEQIKAQVEAGLPLVTALRLAGWSDEQIKQMQEEKRKEQEANKASLGEALLAAQRGFDQGGGSADRNQGSAGQGSAGQGSGREGSAGQANQDQGND